MSAFRQLRPISAGRRNPPYPLGPGSPSPPSPPALRYSFRPSASTTTHRRGCSQIRLPERRRRFCWRLLGTADLRLRPLRCTSPRVQRLLAVASGQPTANAIGPWKFLAFFVASALVSSSAQLAFSDDTGIGASGVVYAMFGFHDAHALSLLHVLFDREREEHPTLPHLARRLLCRHSLGHLECGERRPPVRPRLWHARHRPGSPPAAVSRSRSRGYAPSIGRLAVLGPLVDYLDERQSLRCPWSPGLRPSDGALYAPSSHATRRTSGRMKSWRSAGYLEHYEEADADSPKPTNSLPRPVNARSHHHSITSTS